MIHTRCTETTESSQQGAPGPESLAFASRLEEQSGSTRGRAKNAKPEKPGPSQNCSDCKWFTVILVQRALICLLDDWSVLL